MEFHTNEGTFRVSVGVRAEKVLARMRGNGWKFEDFIRIVEAGDGLKLFSSQPECGRNTAFEITFAFQKLELVGADFPDLETSNQIASAKEATAEAADHYARALGRSVVAAYKKDVEPQMRAMVEQEVRNVIRQEIANSGLNGRAARMVQSAIDKMGKAASM